MRVSIVLIVVITLSGCTNTLRVVSTEDLAQEVDYSGNQVSEIVVAGGQTYNVHSATVDGDVIRWRSENSKQFQTTPLHDISSITLTSRVGGALLGLRNGFLVGVGIFGGVSGGYVVATEPCFQDNRCWGTALLWGSTGGIISAPVGMLIGLAEGNRRELIVGDRVIKER
jgi:uncharacterized protein YceK